MSHIRYGITVWHHGQVALRKKIQACANKFLRMIYFKKYRESVKPLMNELKMLSVNQIHHLEVAKIMAKTKLGMIPEPFNDILENQTRLSTIVTRRASTYYQRFTTLEKCKQAIGYFGPFVWNSIPVDVKIKSDNNIFITPDVSDSVDFDHKKSNLKQFSKRMKKYSLENVNFI